MATETAAKRKRRLPDCVPDGVYNVTVLRVIARPGRTSTVPDLVWTLRIDDPPYDGKRMRLYTSLAADEIWRFKSILMALGVYEDGMPIKTADKNYEIVDPALKGLRARARIQCEHVLDVFAGPPVASDKRDGKDQTMAEKKKEWTRDPNRSLEVGFVVAVALRDGATPYVGRIIALDQYGIRIEMVSYVTGGYTYWDAFIPWTGLAHMWVCTPELADEEHFLSEAAPSFQKMYTRSPAPATEQDADAEW